MYPASSPGRTSTIERSSTTPGAIAPSQIATRKTSALNGSISLYQAVTPYPSSNTPSGEASRSAHGTLDSPESWAATENSNHQAMATLPHDHPSPAIPSYTSDTAPDSPPAAPTQPHTSQMDTSWLNTTTIITTSQAQMTPPRQYEKVVLSSPCRPYRTTNPPGRSRPPAANRINHLRVRAHPGLCPAAQIVRGSRADSRRERAHERTR